MTQYPRAKRVKIDARIKAHTVLAEQNSHLDGRVRTCGIEKERKAEVMRKFFSYSEMYRDRGYAIPQTDDRSRLL